MARFSIESVFKAVDKVTAPVTRMQNRVNKFTRSMSVGMNKLDRNINKVVGTLGRGAKNAINFGLIGLGTITTAITLLVKEFSKIEDAEAAFTPLLGGAEKAKKLVDELNKTAASTPFQFETLAATANQLLPVMNGNIQNTIKTLRMLGDTAGGNAQKLDSITRGFTKAMLKGKVDMESLNMIAEAGVPIFGDLAEVMGTKVNGAFFKMVSAGKVTTEQLAKAFEKMTSKGGMFFNGMDIASKTTTGLWSTLKDNISLTAAEIGGVLAPVIKDILRSSTDTARSVREWVKANRQLISDKFIKFVETMKNVVLKTVDSLNTLNTKHSIIDNFIDGIVSLGDAFGFLSRHGKSIAIVIGGMIGLSLVLKTFVGIMGAVNLVMSLNPFALMVIGISALIGAFSAIVIWVDDIKSAFESMPDVIQGILSPIKLFIDGIKFVKDNMGKISGFFGIGDSDQQSQPQTQMISPQSRIANSIEEKRQTSTATVTIKDESGRATVTNGNLGNSISLESTGGF